MSSKDAWPFERGNQRDMSSMSATNPYMTKRSSNPLILSIAMLCSCHTTQNILCVVLIVSLRQFDSKGIIIYYVASEGLCHDVQMTKLRLGTFLREQN